MIPPYTPFEEKARDAVGHKVKISFRNERNDCIGYCTSFSRALDNEPEIACVDVEPMPDGDWYESFYETEVKDITILD